MPFISVCPVGGRRRSPYCDSASRSERDTSRDVVVVQSTSSGNKPINCSQATLSTENKLIQNFHLVKNANNQRLLRVGLQRKSPLTLGRWCFLHRNNQRGNGFHHK